MKLIKNTNIYKASNVTFNADTLEAHSYVWWKFVSVLNGKLVFNRYNFSPTTIKHQWKVRRLLDSLGLYIDIEIEAPKGLDRLDIAVEHYENRIKKLNTEMLLPRKRKATVERLAKEAKELTDELVFIKCIKQ